MTTLVKNGHPHAQIVISGRVDRAEHNAALELRKYLAQMSGAELNIVTTPHPELSNLFVGAAARTEGLDLNEETLGFDGYVVNTVGRAVRLAGLKPYSSLYAVYHLLERHLGCGFFEDGDQVPKITDIAFKLPPGQTSDIFRAPDGYCILKVEDRRPAGVKPLAQVQQEITARLKQQRQSQARQEWLLTAPQRVRLTITDPRLRRAVQRLLKVAPPQYL